MKGTITVRDVNPGDKSWLQHEARRLGVSMEEFVCRLIRKERQKARTQEKPSEVFQRYFGPEHGIELPQRGRVGYRPVRFENGQEG